MLGLFQDKPDLIVHSRDPLNAEPPLARLRSRFLTDTADFYIRTHGNMPEPDAEKHRVTVKGDVARERTWTLRDLQGRFETRTVTAVMQCAGNRRADLQEVRATTGDPWAPGAIGNAEWIGASLADVLREADVRERPGLHVAFEALDIARNEGAKDAPYGASIPLEKAMSGEVILAWGMNGSSLRREHGAPLRIVVPGYAGVRSVKWVSAIRVQPKPSNAFQQRHDYLLFPPDMSPETQDPARGTAIYEMPLNSAICEPGPETTLPAGSTTVRGYAIATGRPIVRVDVSVNGGRDWQQATLEEKGDQPWSWTFWHIAVDLWKGEHELVVRAWDAAGQTQPSRPDDVWNFKGYLSAAWHRIRVRVD
ncbi:sulfite oxidase [Faunimonas pinastri]|uniref:Sulfite oxidase n=1 Tax=Faunimonas pinastri TaxID=1855383 RepID=A0A1H9ILV0_9HYPH|nr:molybdopterin-dependent oxidoreductase [Faunimonas pinastri]SEQ75564.1 sulfite oxidase [Faunimonas pinastri]